jgi:hypothetical protein
MFTENPFAELPGFVSPELLQGYVIVMICLVAGGTLFDIVHKKSARYFFNNWRQSKRNAKRTVSGSEMVSLFVKTALVDWLMSAEFCNARRRVAHLLTMYGFLAHVIATVILVFSYTSSAMPAPELLVMAWYLGGLMVCLGGYWFWFFIRVDVAAEGHGPFRLIRADLFILSLLASTTLGLAWAWMQSNDSGWANVMFYLYLIATTLLFGSVPWSKFSHMFYKPAAALQKRISQADASRNNLPEPADQPEIFGSSRELPRHY